MSHTPTFELRWYVHTEEVSPGRWRAEGHLLPDVKVEGNAKVYSVQLVSAEKGPVTEASSIDKAEGIVVAAILMTTHQRIALG